MRIILSIPCLHGAFHTEEAIKSVLNCDLLLVDNGASEDVKAVIKKYESATVKVIRNQKNMYVNFAWQQAIDYFLESNYDYLVIMNSDITCHRAWKQVLYNRWERNPDEILIPVIQDNINIDVAPFIAPAQEVFSGTPGVFITLNKKQANIISPIPEVIKIWFADNWIFDTLRTLGYKTVIPSNLLVSHFHNGSQNVQRVKEAPAIIEQDKVAWNNIVLPKMKELIAKLLGG